MSCCNPELSTSLEKCTTTTTTRARATQSYLRDGSDGAQLTYEFSVLSSQRIDSKSICWTRRSTVQFSSVATGGRSASRMLIIAPSNSLPVNKRFAHSASHSLTSECQFEGAFNDEKKEMTVSRKRKLCAPNRETNLFHQLPFLTSTYLLCAQPNGRTRGGN